MAWKPKSVPDVLEPGTNEFELVEFWMYDEREDGEIYNYIFGVNVAKVKEVVWLPEIIKVPNLPEAIVGVINLRGQVIPLIDLGKWMHINEPKNLKRKSVIITEFYKVKIGFIVHEAKRIRRVTWDKIKPPPDVLVAQFGTKITGVIEIGDEQFLLILDLENVLAELGLITMPDEELEVEEVPEDVKGPVLIADDSSVARKILKDIYTKAGFDELIIVKDGEEAWRTLRAILEKAQQEGKDILDYVSLVVTDVEMPRMDGYTLTRKIKEDPELSKLPVIINSSLSEESNIQKAEQVHADAFFVKFEPEELIKVSKELIHRARKGQLGSETLTNIPSEKAGHHISEMEEKKSSNLKSNGVINKKANNNSDGGSSRMMEEAKQPNGNPSDEIDKLLAEIDGAGEGQQEAPQEESKSPAEEADQVNSESPADEIDQLLAEVQGEKAEAEEAGSTDEGEKESPADEIDQLLAEVQEETSQETQAEGEESPADEIDKLLAEIQGEKREEEPSEEAQEQVDDIDALIEAYQNQSGSQEEEPQAGEEDVPDIVDQILAELESGKMGAEGATNEAGAYEVPTAEKLAERDDVGEIIKKLEERLAQLTDEDEDLKVELIAMIESLKAQLEKQRKEREETRVIAKLYKVTRETEEETVKLMEILEKAMDLTGECVNIADEFPDSEAKTKLIDKLNEINDTLFTAINHLQFQDITRQKIERIIAALKKLNDYLNEWFGTDFIGD